ncbi:alpha-L-rhamnosidase [Kiritimatiella glycovorans]|uniref:alpha-L-rhamnosidase n=1 Tax=Kiritimatiella glycovorans TaxID=1307763 RepID=A0A0G3ECX2_9BACT|nr:alpha-L-rhamnosidase [Kiritimatiella glycovorans]AKJ64168.1 Alpha-L-rhamnosidase [Kiritimatiella glycovorans]
MMTQKTTRWIAAFAAVLISGVVQAETLRPVWPQCERLETAILKPGQTPEFSWGLDADGRDGAAQSAYQIKVATPDGKAVWDSGKVESDDTLDVPYGGPALAPASQFDWQVRVFDEKGKASDWTDPQRFFTGLKSWKSQWITSPEIAALAGNRDKLLEYHPVRMFRQEWSIEKPVKTATLYLSSLGCYRGWINGQLVSEDRFAPSIAQYGIRIFYRAYDVGDLLKAGDNAIAAILGRGSFADGKFGSYGQDFVTRLRAQLEIEYADGSRETVATGPDWRSMQERSPWRSADFNLGGTYDARLFDPAWTTVDFDDSDWKQAVVSAPKEGTLFDPDPVAPCRITEVLKPVTEYEPEPGVYVIDFGKQWAGVCRFTVSLPEGHEVHLRHAQVLRKDRMIDTRNLRHNAENQTTYIAAGTGDEHFEGIPFHYNGCRYVEVRGLPSRDALKEIEVIHLSDTMREVSSFRSSSERLNKLWAMIRQTYLGNLRAGILQGCAGRSERCAWLGDGYTSHVGAIEYFFDSAAHHRKRMQDVRDQVAYRGGTTHPGQVGCRAPSFGTAACPFWSDAATLIPRNAHILYDDIGIVEDQYGDGDGQAKALLDFYLQANAPSGKWTAVNQKGCKIWGPWLGRGMLLPPGSGQDRWNSADYPSDWYWKNRGQLKKSVSKEAFGTAWWSISAQATADMARFLGKESEAREYDAMAERSNEALISEFDNGDGTWDYNDQPIYTYGLYSGAATGDLEAHFLKNLIDAVENYGGHSSGGSDSIRLMLQTLSEQGYGDLAWFMAMRPEMPSFGYMVDAGATTSWERFDLDHPEWGLNFTGGTVSKNHVGYLPVGQWIVEDIVGLRPDPAQPGFKHFFIKPWTGSEPKQMDFRFDSSRGPIRVAWERSGDQVTLNAEVPPNCSATVQWPGGKEETLGSGTHTLTGDAPLKQGEGVEGGLDEIRRYFKANPYDPAKDTNRYFEIKKAKEAAAAEPSGVFTPVIEWNMEALSPHGTVPNAVGEGPYVDAGLTLKGARIVDDPERGKVLAFDGEGATAESLFKWDGHRGIRVEMAVRNEAPTGQSVLLAVPHVFRVFKVAGFAQMAFSSNLKPDVHANSAGIPVLDTGEWRTITAEFDPANGIARIECDGKVATLPVAPGDTLASKKWPIQLGSKLNAFFKGQIDDIRISVMD